jgi:serine/threonine-protein kinase
MGPDRDGREDVHGLGVLLHEVVGGRHPDQGAALPRGDLRAIAARCLAPDPADRYASAGDVAEDLRRHLHHLPIRARRPGCLYASRKAIRRYFAPLIAVVAASVVLVVVAAMAVTEALRAEQARQSAAEARVRADLALRDLETVRSRAREASVRDLQVAEFLGSVLAPPDQGLTIDPAVSDAVEAALARLDSGELASNPEAEAAARTSLASALQALGRSDEARAQYQHVLELEQQGWLPETDLSVARSLRALADPRHEGVEEGRAMLERALDIVRAAHGEDHPDVAETWLAIGRFHRIAGAFDASERAIREAIDRLDARVGTPAAQRADARQQLAAVMRTVGRYDQAEVVLREALDLDLATFGPDHLRVATDRLMLGSLLADAGRADEGLPLIDEALAARLAQLGETHPRTVGARLNRVDALMALRRPSAAQRELDLAMVAERRRTGERPESAGWWVRRAEVALLRGNGREAHGFADRALLEREQELGLAHWRTAVARGLVGRALLARNRKRQSEPYLREAREILLATVGPDSHHLPPIEESLARLGIE